MSLEERLFKSFDDQQKVEHEAREIESLIKSFDGTSSLIGERSDWYICSRKTIICPKCGKKEVRKAVLGYPTEEFAGLTFFLKSV